MIPPNTKPKPSNSKTLDFNKNINWDIRAKEVRVIGADNQQLGIKTLEEAIHIAAEDGLDLVEVASQEAPPVCKIMDFGKFKYRESKKRAKSISTSAKSVVKELRLRPKTEEHDVVVKVEQAKNFLEKGYKVLFTIMFKGREIRYQENGQLLLNRVLELLEGMAKVEKPASKVDARKMQMTLVSTNPPK